MAFSVVKDEMNYNLVQFKVMVLRHNFSKNPKIGLRADRYIYLAPSIIFLASGRIE